MSHRISDRVRETSATTGTGSYALLGAVAGFQSMAASLTADGDTGFFFAKNETDWETFLGTRVNATTLARTIIYSSSNAGSPISWTSGTKEIVGDISARYAEMLNTISAPVASGSTTDIGAVNSSVIEITGTTTINSFGTSANKLRFVKFSGQLTLTHNATTLILPGGANINAKAGDCATFVSDTSGNWRCLDYQPYLAPDLEGTFIPGLTFGGASTGITFSEQLGVFQKRGNWVYFTIQLTLTAVGSASGDALITNLPFTAAAGIYHPVSLWASLIIVSNPSTAHIQCIVDAAAATISLWANDYSTLTSVQLTNINFANLPQIIISGHYHIA